MRWGTMYYSSGNYEACARPRKPDGVDGKTAWFVGSGLASLAAAAFMIRDVRMAGNSITVLERLKLPGGALDGIQAVHSTGSRNRRRASSFAVVARWKITSNVCGTCSVLSPRSRSRTPACSTNSTGSTKTTRTIRCSASQNVRVRMRTQTSSSI
ncbi:oleate hydratase [Rhodococcus qingshengii]|uniref:oleate hydratase n=1 Tax=Rhodococcus qingshengii TaxID=334542 RepID=UPI003B982B41